MSFESEYAKWWQAVAPSAVAEYQTQEMERAFYSGALCVITMIMAQVPEDSGKEDEVAMARAAQKLADINQEISDFFDALRPGNIN